MDNEGAIQRFHQLGSFDDVTDGLVVSDLLSTSQVLKFVNVSTLIRYLGVVLIKLGLTIVLGRSKEKRVQMLIFIPLLYLNKLKMRL